MAAWEDWILPLSQSVTVGGESLGQMLQIKIILLGRLVCLNL